MSLIPFHTTRLVLFVFVLTRKPTPFRDSLPRFTFLITVWRHEACQRSRAPRQGLPHPRRVGCPQGRQVSDRDGDRTHTARPLVFSPSLHHSLRLTLDPSLPPPRSSHYLITSLKRPGIDFSSKQRCLDWIRENSPIDFSEVRRERESYLKDYLATFKNLTGTGVGSVQYDDRSSYPFIEFHEAMDNETPAQIAKIYRVPVEALVKKNKEYFVGFSSDSPLERGTQVQINKLEKVRSGVKCGIIAKQMGRARHVFVLQGTLLCTLLYARHVTYCQSPDYCRQPPNLNS